MSMASGQSELIQAALNGDGGAFADVIRADYAVAFRLAFGLLHDSQEAEDAVQEAVFKAWRKLGNLREGSPLRPWFLAIVANQCRSMRKRRRWSVQEAEEIPEAAAPSLDIAAALDLRRALARLGHDERLILVLRYYLDLPFDEIAATLDVTPKAARSRVERAVARLRPIVTMEEALT